MKIHNMQNMQNEKNDCQAGNMKGKMQEIHVEAKHGPQRPMRGSKCKEPSGTAAQKRHGAAPRRRLWCENDTMGQQRVKKWCGDIAEKKQHDTSKVPRLPRRMTWEVSKVLPLPRKMQCIFWKPRKVLRLPHKTTFDTLWNMLECHEVPRLPCKTTLQRALKPSTREGFAASPMDNGTAPQKPASRDETCWSIKTSISCETSSNFTLRSVKIDVFLRGFLWTYLKIDVSCEASVHFHHVSQSATPGTEFARCRHFAQHWQSDSQKTRNTTRLKCCACHAKWHGRSPKCCACHAKCNASSENVAKVLRLPHKTTFVTSCNMLKCHKVPRLPRKMTLCDAGKLEKWHFCRTYHRHGHMVLMRTVANGCGRLRTVSQRLANTALPPHPSYSQSETGTLATHSGPPFVVVLTMFSLWKAAFFSHCPMIFPWNPPISVGFSPQPRQRFCKIPSRGPHYPPRYWRPRPGRIHVTKPNWVNN